MIRELEKELNRYQSRIIEHATLSSILKKMDYKRINDKIAQLKNKGILTPLKNRYYIYNPLHDDSLISKEVIANTLLGPSYISLEYALWFYDLIPESVYEVTSVTTKRSKSFDTPYGVFSYRQTKKELFNVGLEIQSSKNGNYIIASKEKALCDKLYFAKDLELRSKKAMREFLEDDLRLDTDWFGNCDMSIFQTYFKISRSKKIETLIKVVKEFRL